MTTNQLDNYMSTRDAAIAIGIEYPTLMARIRKGKIKAEKIGWNKLVHKDEVKRAKKAQKNATSKNMEKSSR